jgi:L-ascorbate metabolism protein UlaG (beta-lactamase superfamily)
MALIRELFRPDVALLPIGGHYTMDPAGAALAAGLLGVTHVLPIHWGTFPLLAGTPAALADAIAARGGTAQVIDWRPGDTLD